MAHRGGYDLTQHAKHSGKDLTYFEEEAWAKADKSAVRGATRSGEQEEKAKYRFLPHVIEPSAGADRFTLAVLCEAYDEDEVEGEDADGHALPPAAGADQGRRLAAGEQGRDAGDRARRCIAS